MFKGICICILILYQIELCELKVHETDELDLLKGIVKTLSRNYYVLYKGRWESIKSSKALKALRALKITLANATKFASNKPAHKGEDRSIADELSKKVRVLCWVMTQPDNHEKKARHVKATWGKRCNKLLFMSSGYDKKLPTVKLPVREGRDYLWGKTKAAFRYVYKHHRREADWFLKADDDTYVVMENLRYMLADYDTQSLVYFGCRYRKEPQGFMVGGTGYVLSRAALDVFVNKALLASHLCDPTDRGSEEDVKISECLENVGVKPIDTRDIRQRRRFIFYPLQEHLYPYNTKKFDTLWYPTKKGLDCCSDHAVSFHFVTPEQMYLIDYLIYHLKIHGIKNEGGLPKILKGNNSELVGR